MSHGGVREGAGRKAGPTQLAIRTRKIAEKAAADGLTPLEVMLDNMTFAHKGAGAFLEKLIAEHEQTPIDKFNAYKEMMTLRAVAQEAAKDAAPYMHPRLAAVEVSGKDGDPIRHEVVWLPSKD